MRFGLNFFQVNSAPLLITELAYPTQVRPFNIAVLTLNADFFIVARENYVTVQYDVV